MKFYRCIHCKQIVAMVEDKNVPLTCCHEEMKELKPNTTDAANEKHVPVVTVDQNRVHVKVGSVTHPMSEEHYIEWIVLSTNKGNYRRILHPNDAPEADFLLVDGEVVEKAYAYCNLHSLWSN